MAMLSDLPDHVVAKIFSFLPAKSVLRLKGVKKSWNILVKALVKTPSFVADHLYNSTNNRPTYSSFIFNSSYRNSGSDNSDNKLTLLTLHHHNSGDVEVELSEIPNQVNALVARKLVIFTHCDGMVCMVDPYATFVELRNPATREVKVLSSPGFSNKSPASVTDLFAGFGYDAVSRAYKLIVAYQQHGATDFVAKVCTLGRDMWREVEISTEKVGASHLLFTGSGLCCGGVCYWLANVGYSTKVLCFDMHSEKFDAVSLPRVFLSEERGLARCLKLLRLGNSLALYCDPAPGREILLSVCVWVMSHNDKSWKRHNMFTNKLNRVGKVIGFSKTGHEILMFGHHRAYRGFIAYNVAQDKLRCIYAGKTIDEAHLIPYVDSFLAP